MALDNVTVLGNLKSQLKEVTGQLNTLNETRVKLLGAIDVLEQIEDSKRNQYNPKLWRLRKNEIF